MKKIAIVLLVLISIGAGIYIYGSSQSANNNKTDSLPNSIFSKAHPQWEYLVISFGKTYFTAPNETPETKTSGYSKLISYSKVGIVSAQEALGTQSQMDTLGKFGWELVGVVGAIGGDQQMLFRRSFDADRSIKEAEMIKAEGARLLAAQEKASKDQAAQEKIALEKAEKDAANAGGAELIDLDAVDAATARVARAVATNETRRKEEARLKDAISRIKEYAIADVKVTSSASAPNDSNVTAEVAVDGTTSLLKDGNKYRTSEVKALAKQIAVQLYKSAGLKQSASYYDLFDSYEKKVSILVTVKINFSNTTKVVETIQIGGVWPEHQNR